MIIPLSRVSRFPILALVLSLLGGGLSGWGETAAPPLFQFGLVTDVQYADKPAAGGRDYRGALVRLRSAVATLNGESLAFTAQLGDLIDGNGEASLTDLRAVLDALRGLRAPLHHVIGNHAFT